MPGYRVFRWDDLDFARPSAGDRSRGIVRLSDSLTSIRANIWRLPAGARGRRHREPVQEEIFVALAGTATLRLGEAGEAIALPAGSVAVVQAQTPLQLTNDGPDDAIVLAVGAPPVVGEAEYLPDL